MQRSSEYFNSIHILHKMPINTRYFDFWPVSTYCFNNLSAAHRHLCYFLFVSIEAKPVFYKALWVICLKGCSFMIFVLFCEVYFSFRSHGTYISISFFSPFHFQPLKSLGIVQTQVSEVWLHTAAVIRSSWFDQCTWNHKRSKLLFAGVSLSSLADSNRLYLKCTLLVISRSFIHTKCHHCCLSTLTSKTYLGNQLHQVHQLCTVFSLISQHFIFFLSTVWFIHDLRRFCLPYL